MTRWKNTVWSWMFQSTPPVKAATRCNVIHLSIDLVSIHAAREGGDPALQRGPRVAAVSIHAAREGGDEIRQELGKTSTKFQSTPPVKAATA